MPLCCAESNSVQNFEIWSFGGLEGFEFFVLGRHPVIVRLLSGYHPVIIRLSYGYHTVIVRLSSGYCPVIVRNCWKLSIIDSCPSPTDSLISLSHSMAAFCAYLFGLFKKVLGSEWFEVQTYRGVQILGLGKKGSEKFSYT